MAFSIAIIMHATTPAVARPTKYRILLSSVDGTGTFVCTTMAKPAISADMLPGFGARGLLMHEVSLNVFRTKCRAHLSPLAALLSP